MHWVVTMNAYYHSLYLSAIKDLAELYIKSGLYDELEAICNEALHYDNVDEQLYYYLIYARMKRNKFKLTNEIKIKTIIAISLMLLLFLSFFF